MIAQRFFRPALAAALFAMTAGCVSLLPENDPVSIHRLTLPEPHEWVGGDWQTVEVETLRAPRGLSGAEIPLVREQRSLAYVAGAQWIEPMPQLLQNLIIGTFNATDDGLAPVRPEDGTRADFGLRLDLRDFEADYDRGDSAAPLVRVRIAARLVEGSQRGLLAAQVFDSEVRAQSNSTRAIVAAFDQAANSVAQELASWTARHAVLPEDDDSA